MARLQQGIQQSQNVRLLGALLSSARRRDRELLRSRVTSARSARSDANQLAYDRAVHKFRRADAVDRPTFYQNYKGAMTSAERASEVIMKAAIEAGAGDQSIVAYVTDDFCSSVCSFMRTSFEQRPDARHTAKRRDELQLLEDNTSVQAQALAHRVQALRSEAERDQPGRLDRIRHWFADVWGR
jgi:hypothetical protein